MLAGLVKNAIWALALRIVISRHQIVVMVYAPIFRQTILTVARAEMHVERVKLAIWALVFVCQLRQIFVAIPVSICNQMS